MSGWRTITYLTVILIATATGVGLSNIPIAAKQMGNERVILKTDLPEVKVVPVYKISNIDKTLIPPQKLKDVNSLPAKEKALKILFDFLGRRYRGMVLKNIETVTTKVMNVENGKIVEEKPEFVSVIYGREIDGIPVIGPAADGIVAAIANDKVIYLSKLWRDVEKIGEIKVIPSEKALEKLKNGETLNKPLFAGDKLYVIKIKIAYYAANLEQKYYNVVWLFKCLDNHGNGVDVIVNAVEGG